MKKLLLLSIVALFQCYSFSQTSLDNFNYQIYYKTTSTDTAVFDSLCTRMCKVTLDDTTNIAFIKVKIGTTEGAGDILQYDFIYDNNVGLPAGLSYLREQNEIYLGLFETTQIDMYYYEIQLQDIQGNLSSAKRWN